MVVRSIAIGTTCINLILALYYFFFSQVETKSSRMNLKGSYSNHHGRYELRHHPQIFNERNQVSDAEHLIIVAGHSVTISGHLEDAEIDEKDWYLLGYQKGKGLPQAIIAHIRAGILEAAKDPKSLLIFSGGETRSDAGPETEGGSYFRVSDAMNLWGEPRKRDEYFPGAFDVRARTTSEEFATDSFQNIMFSICRFKEVTGSYPIKITVVSFSFKKKRFVDLHAPALRFPPEHFHFIGVDPDDSTGFDIKASSEGELMNAAKPFETDPYGCNTEVLIKKRKERNPFFRTPPYEISCPNMSPLLTWCEKQIIPASKVPW